MITDARLRTLRFKADSKNRYPDRDGMYVHVSPAGSISFRYEYKWPRTSDGKHQVITYGRYPVLTLDAARDAHIDALRKMREGVNPMDERRTEKQLQVASAGNTFKAVGERWYEKNRPGKSDSWLEANRRHLEASYPTIGAKPISEVTTRDIHAIVRAVENSGRIVTAEKMRQTYMMVFDHAAGVELIVESGVNPARVITVKVPKAKHHPHLQAQEIPAFVAGIDGATETTERTRLAAKLILLCLTRKTELITTKWAEIDFTNARWEIRQKGDRPHVVPLSRQALACFARARELTKAEYVFPNERDPRNPMGETTLNRLLERLGYKGKLTVHGLRGTASTILNELGYRRDVIEKQLGHTEADEVRAAYNHAEYMEERRRMLQDWADAIDRLCAGQPLRPQAENVTDIRAARAA